MRTMLPAKIKIRVITMFCRLRDRVRVIVNSEAPLGRVLVNKLAGSLRNLERDVARALARARSEIRVSGE